MFIHASSNYSLTFHRYVCYPKRDSLMNKLCREIIHIAVTLRNNVLITVEDEENVLTPDGNMFT